MSALSALQAGAARAAGTALVAGLLVVVGAVGAQQAVAVGLDEVAGAVPTKAKPGGAPGGFTVWLPDGRVLHFSYAPAPGAGTHRPPSGPPGSSPPSGAPSGAPSGSPSGTPSTQPSAQPSGSGLPVPVVSSLFPSPDPSGSSGGHKPSARPSRGAAGPQQAASATRTTRADPAQDGGDAVVPGDAQPQRPASTVPPPLGPLAVLHPDTTNEQIASPRGPGSGLGHRARLLGVGLALIGSGAALFGWRIRRL